MFLNLFILLWCIEASTITTKFCLNRSKMCSPRMIMSFLLVYLHFSVSNMSLNIIKYYTTVPFVNHQPLYDW